MEFRNFYVKVYSSEYTIFFAPRGQLVYMRTLGKRIQVRPRVMNKQMVQKEKNLLVGKLRSTGYFLLITITYTDILQCFQKLINNS